MTKKEAFFRLIALLDQERIRYALVGDVDEYPDHIGSDVDIVTDETGLSKFHRAVWSLENDGLRVVQCFQHEITAFYYVLAFRDAGGRWGFIQPDICTDYFRRAVKLLDAAPLVERSRVRPCAGCPGGGFRVLSARDELLYYFLKKTGKLTPVTEAQAAHMQKTFAEDPGGCRDAVAPFGAEALAALGAIAFGDAAALSAALPRIKREILRSGVLPPPRLLRDAARKLRRILRPTGLVVAMPGASPWCDFALHHALAGAFRRHADFSASEPRLVRKLFKARTASTLAVLDRVPKWPARGLVDAVLPEAGDGDASPPDRILDVLAARAARRAHL